MLVAGALLGTRHGSRSGDLRMASLSTLREAAVTGLAGPRLACWLASRLGVKREFCWWGLSEYPASKVEWTSGPWGYALAGPAWACKLAGWLHVRPAGPAGRES